MFKTILRTVFTKGTGSILNFLIVIITARCMGAEGRGEISLVVLNITVILLLNDILGGGALVFLVPRYQLYSLLLPSWIWGLICGLVFPLGFYLFGSITQQEYLTMTLLSIFLNLSSINSAALNGKELIRENNIVSLAQVISLVILLVALMLGTGKQTPETFYMALLLSYVFSFLLSLYYLRGAIVIGPVLRFKRLFSQMTRSGFHLQLGNAVQLLNYRLSFYLINHFFPAGGKSMLGVYSTATSICESVWVISNGISMVQYARISNMSSRKEAQELTVSLSKISFLATLGVVAVMLCLPSSVFRFLFGAGFIEIPCIILYLSAGICAFGLASMYSHYFAGIGKMHISTQGSLVGFAVTGCLGFILVPRFGIGGAAITACCSYLASALFLLLKFRKESGDNFRHLIFGFQGIFSSIKTLGTDVRNKRDH